MDYYEGDNNMNDDNQLQNNNNKKLHPNNENRWFVATKNHSCVFF